MTTITFTNAVVGAITGVYFARNGKPVIEVELKCDKRKRSHITRVVIGHDTGLSFNEVRMLRKGTRFSGSGRSYSVQTLVPTGKVRRMKIFKIYMTIIKIEK